MAIASGSYRVEILHYLNPHLLWVEVESNSSEDFVFEQIGVYGVLPHEVTLNETTLAVETRKCDQWTPAAYIVMKKTFSDALEVWFCPTHLDRRTSIFDDNIHKYGELVIKKKNGKFKTLTQQLVKSGFALYDTALFHQALSTGNLKTKLSALQIQEVIKHLEKCDNKPRKEWERAVKKSTTIFHKAQNLESMLTVHNLQQHEKVQKLLQDKIKDFERCKDVDEDSVGRAIVKSRGHLRTNDETSVKGLAKQSPVNNLTQDATISSSKRKLEIIKSKRSSNQDTAEILLATKKFLEKNAVKRGTSESSDNRTTDIDDGNSAVDVKPNSLSGKLKLLKNYAPKKDERKQNSNKESTSKVNSSDEKVKIQNDYCVAQSTPAKTAIDNRNDEVDSSDIMPKASNNDDGIVNPVYVALPSPVKLTKAKKKSKSPKSEYDIENEKRVAFGPPGMCHQKLSLKIVPKVTIEDNVNLESPENVAENIDEQETSQRRDVFDGLDSEVNIEITNKDILKTIHKEIQADLKANSFSTEAQNSSSQYIYKISNVDNTTSNDLSQSDSSSERRKALRSNLLQRKVKLYKETKSSDDSLSSSDVAKDSSIECNGKDNNSYDSDDNVEEILQKLNLEYNIIPKKEATKEQIIKDLIPEDRNNVNPFKNLDATISVFVDKLVTPVLMVHTKMNKRIQPCMELRDVNFNTNIHVALANMSVKHPMMLQSVSWFTILRGYNLFMVSPVNSGKTMGYLPAVCRLVTDYKTDTLNNEGPSCIIVCATAKAASEVERLSKMFLGLKERVLTCYTGMDELHITTSLLNGCDLLISTPSMLLRLLQMTDFGVDLRRLATVVLDDCERLSEVYIHEVKFFLIKIKEMLKTRANKELKVQIIAASRIWCDFMGPLAKKAPNSVVCIGAFQECVLYSKAKTTVAFVKKETKINKVLDFLEQIDGSKRTVIVCRDDIEVEILEKILQKHGKVVFACNNTMTVHDLYNHSKSWTDYQEPLLGPVLVCCDGNLIHLNVTNAHYLIHYSLPQLFSMFCKRFAVLNDNYPSIFKTDDNVIKIQVLLEDSNVEQLPKILNFIKRCTNEVPQFLDDVCNEVLAEKDANKAKSLVPICENLLAMGECPDFWNCQERHAVLKQFDEPKEWVPKTGHITFKILHYHTAVLYSVRLLSNIVNGKTIKYPQTYSTLSLKMGMYYSKESNKKLHGIPKVGDVCAVAVKINFFARCQVMKILSYYRNRNPHYVLIKLIDEEKFERCSDVYLYYLPDDLKNIESHIVRVRLANIKPKDKDVTFSELATNELKKVTDKPDLYLRGKVSLAIGNCVLVDTLEACQDLTTIKETVVNENLRKVLIDNHAIPNPEHVPKLINMCHEGQLALDVGNQVVEESKPVKVQLQPNWAHLDQGDVQTVFFASAESPGSFFLRLVKFDDCMNVLLKDIEEYVNNNTEPPAEVAKGYFVLAKFPDDKVYERARIDEVYDENKVKCFFVDQGDWRDIWIKDLLEIPEKFLTQMPCQAIECRLTGILPAAENWTEFGTNWFSDTCFEDDDGNIKQLYVKYFTKETATHTQGHKYGIALIDTYGERDVVINQAMIDKNLAREYEDEVKFFQEFNSNKPESTVLSSTDEEEWEKISNKEVADVDASVDIPQESLDKVFHKKPIRSVPLVQDDDEDDKWDVNITSDFMAMFKNLASSAQKITEIKEDVKPNVRQTKLPATKSSQFSAKETNKKSDVTETATRESNIKAEEKQIKNKTNSEVLDSDDLSSAESTTSSKFQRITNTEVKKQNEQKDELRKPKLIWRQHKDAIIIKIQLIGVESYYLEVGQRSLQFETYANDTKYGFNFELYGVIDTKCYYHSNKGQYILINLKKLLNRKWLSLARDVTHNKWIVYDMDSIDTSSDEEDDIDRETIKHVVRNMQDSSSDSDDDFIDDSRF